MEKYLISDEEFEHIGIEFNLARNLVRYLQLVDKRTRKIILEELYNRESKPDIPYNLGKVSFKYFKVDDCKPNKEKLVSDFGLEAVLAISTISQKSISELLREQRLIPDPTLYLIKVGEHDILSTPKILPIVKKDEVEEIISALVSKALANKKT
ncbi:hypothetical protein J4471_00620 [Candidatus Woesearchaeota archaeon]|nr:hypothetical protein [Candidatus Woesearchaeota archaeon]